MNEAKPEIVVLEDDPGVQFVYREILAEAYEQRFISSLGEFEAFLKTSERAPSLLIADVTLPDGSFTQFFLEDRWSARWRDMPILVVSMIDELATIERFLGSEHRDYLTKPFNHNELLAKVRRLTQLSQARPISISPDSLRVARGVHKSEPLTATEAKIFSTLTSSPEHQRSRKTIMEIVWGESDENKKLEVSISRLRRKLQPLGVTISFAEPDAYKLVIVEADA